MFNSNLRAMQSCVTLLVRCSLISLACLSVFAHSANGTVETRLFDSGQGAIEVFIFGEGRDTLIIAAGNGRPAAQLEKLAQDIAAHGIRVVTYNYRSIGASTGSLENLTLHDFADDVWRVASALGLEKVHLAGKTYGNRVMRTAAADMPGRASSVILIGAGGGKTPLSSEIKSLYRRWMDPRTSPEEWQEIQGELMFAPGNEHLASRSASLGMYPQLAAAQGKANSATPGTDWERGGTAPMLILSCLQDRLALPENALSLAKSRTDTWMVGIPQCGHNMILERPGSLSQIIAGFITRLDNSDSQEEARNDNLK